jgi:hypothetical protein
MAKSKKKSRTTAAAKPAVPKVMEDPTYGKKPKGLAAVGFLRSQGTRSFRKRRSGGS